MYNEKHIRKDLNGKATHFMSRRDDNWYDLDLADMSHKNFDGHVDAVVYWNTEGRFKGAKSKEVREWMLNPDNYYLEHRSYNRSEGANLEGYKPPQNKS
jgi:hypothetical protein